jgi:hypothetical protein
MDGGPSLLEMTFIPRVPRYGVGVVMVASRRARIAPIT